MLLAFCLVVGFGVSFLFGILSFLDRRREKPEVDQLIVEYLADMNTPRKIKLKLKGDKK